MIIGVPKEIKNNEFRVAITPAGVHELVPTATRSSCSGRGRARAAIPDDEYVAAGAQPVPTSTWAAAEMLLKVKEPIEAEYAVPARGPGAVHLPAPGRRAGAGTALLAVGRHGHRLRDGAVGHGSLPLLAPMSEVAGRLAPMVGANAMLKPSGGPGVLLAGVPGDRSGEGGRDRRRCRRRERRRRGGRLGRGGDGAGHRTCSGWPNWTRCTPAGCTPSPPTVSRSSGPCSTADLVIGSVLIPGAKAPKLVATSWCRG